MAETVYKKISGLPNATLPLAGTEYVELSATGASKKGLWSGLFGSGWWEKLAAAFSAFKAPDADHADNADTVGGEAPAALHDATALTGVVPLGSIPAELTGKNAATATLAATATNALAVDGYSAGIGVGKLNPVHGYLHGAYTGAQLYAILSSIIPVVNDTIPINGGASSTSGTTDPYVYVLSRATRISSSLIRIYNISYDGYHSTAAYFDISTSETMQFSWSFTY